MRTSIRSIAAVLAVISLSLVSTACSTEMINSSKDSQSDYASTSEFSKFTGSLGFVVVDTNGTIYVGQRTWADLADEGLVPKGDALKGNQSKTITRDDAAYLMEKGDTYEYAGEYGTSRSRNFSINNFSPSTTFTLKAAYMGHDTYDGVEVWF